MQSTDLSNFNYEIFSIPLFYALSYDHNHVSTRSSHKKSTYVLRLWSKYDNNLDQWNHCNYRDYILYSLRSMNPL